MTSDELIDALQKFTPEQRQRQLLMEVDAGYAVVGEVDLINDDDGKKTIAIIPCTMAEN